MSTVESPDPEAGDGRATPDPGSRDSARLRAAILDAALDSLITIDHGGRVLDFNRAAERTFGYTADEAIGNELAELIIPADVRDRHRQGLERCVRTGEGSILDRRVEFTAMRKDGSTLPVELAVTRVPATDPPIFAGYIRDITDIKRTEARALKQSRAIADLAEARGELVSQLMLAEERTRERIAQVLHDDALQRLLAAHQDLMEAAPGREGVSRAQEALEGTIERIREAVAALHPVTLQRGDLETALNAIARQHATGAGFRYTVRVEPDASGLEDRLILSVARELIANVAKHARASRCSVSVVRDREMIRLEVADDGVGIPPGRQETALRDGHIGLASAVQRMKAIGGEGEVSSAPGKGTTVTAMVPISQSKPAPARRS